MYSVSAVVATLFAALVTFFLWRGHASSLGAIPGPWLAKYTDLWRLLNTIGRSPQDAERKLHDELGPVVRLGPNMVSVSDPAFVSKIYSLRPLLTKGSMYEVHDLNINGQRVEHLFSARDEQKVTSWTKPVSKLYSMGHIVTLEPLIDKTISSFLEHLTTQFAKTNAICPMDKWLNYAAWDVISELTFGNRMGFMDKNGDVENINALNSTALDYASVVSMMPWLDSILERNPIMRIGPPGLGPLVGFIIGRLTGRAKGTDGHDPAVPDMLDGFLELHQKLPNEVPEQALMSYTAANVSAGADTVAAELRSVVYHLCRTPTALKKLRAELDTVNITGPVSWSNCQKLPYLGACILEGFRIFPPIQVPLERRVGDGGMAMPDGKTVLPPQTLVGINPYIVAHDRDTFGDDTDTFRPERWLQGQNENAAAFDARLKRMRAADMTFGAGKRGCIGRNIALMEVHKIIGSLFKHFDVEAVSPQKKWKTHNAFMVRQSDIDVKLRRRS